jgi:hypothetical protein
VLPTLEPLSSAAQPKPNVRKTPDTTDGVPHSRTEIDQVKKSEIIAAATTMHEG